MGQYVERRAMDILLRLIAERTAPVVGEEFFRVLVRYLAEGLGVKYAFVAECAGTHTLAFWDGEGLMRSRFGCAGAWAVGQPLERLISKRFRGVLEDGWCSGAGFEGTRAVEAACALIRRASLLVPSSLWTTPTRNSHAAQRLI